jgi:hypothetical protein
MWGHDIGVKLENEHPQGLKLRPFKTLFGTTEQLAEKGRSLKKEMLYERLSYARFAGCGGVLRLLPQAYAVGLPSVARFAG